MADEPKYWDIQFFGCEDLPGQLYDSVRTQVAEFYEKAQRAYFKDIRYMMVHIKQYEQKEGKRKKYSVHLRLAIPAKVFNADYAHFDLNTAVSYSVQALIQQVQTYTDKNKKSWTQTGKHGKRQEFGKTTKEEIENRGKFIRPKLVKR
jgi:ribosome-associated translation inhibitor RaiA